MIVRCHYVHNDPNLERAPIANRASILGRLSAVRARTEVDQARIFDGWVHRAHVATVPAFAEAANALNKPALSPQ
jgi:hypothetical protein